MMKGYVDIQAGWSLMPTSHDDIIKWKHIPRYWPFMRGIHRSPVNSPHKGQWRRALMFSLICAWTNGWPNNRDAGDLRRRWFELPSCSLWYHCNGDIMSITESTGTGEAHLFKDGFKAETQSVHKRRLKYIQIQSWGWKMWSICHKSPWQKRKMQQIIQLVHRDPLNLISSYQGPVSI